MNEGIIPGRYATALYKYAVDNEATLSLYQAAKVVENAFVSYPQLQKKLSNPVMSPEEKLSLMIAAVGDKSGKYYDNFIRLIISKRREEYIRLIFLKYQQLYRKKNNISQVIITTAAELPAEVIKEIESVVYKRADQTIEFVHKIDPSIIGGFIIKIDSMQLDTSVARELKELRLKLINSNKTV